MIACYDLARCPPTYDAVAFLALAEQERLRRGEDHIDIRILPGPEGGFRADGLGTWPHSIEERVRVRDRVLVPLCRLLPSARSVELAPDRRGLAGEWGFGAYHVGLEKILGALRAGLRPLRLLRSPTPGMFARSTPLVTFTLREAEHHPLRNSRVEEWVAAALVLQERGYRVIVVRDAHAAHLDIGNHLSQSQAASCGIAERALLYPFANLNVGISNGPMWMSIFMDAPTLMLRPTTNAAGGCYDDAFYAQMGLPRGSQLPASPPHQRLCWEDDTCENIVRAVEEMLGYRAANGEWLPRGAAGTTIVNDGRPC